MMLSDTGMMFPDGGIIAGFVGLLVGIICLVALYRHRARLEKTHGELQRMLLQHQAECSEQIARLGRNVTVLELSAQNVEENGRGLAHHGLTRSIRSQAMQLLRSGQSPESAASALGVAKREMRLIARVSRLLSLQ